MKAVLLQVAILVGVSMLLVGCAATQGLQATPVIDAMERADNALRRGDLQSAQRDYQRVIEQAPELASPHFQLGVIAYQQRQLNTAMQHFRAARQRNGDHVLATHNLAVVHLESARGLLMVHEQLAPVSAANPQLIAIREAIEALNQAGETAVTR